MLEQQLAHPPPPALCWSPASLALPLSREHSRPSSSQRLPMNQEPEHIQTSLILNETGTFVSKVTNTDVPRVPALGKRLLAAQLFRRAGGWCHVPSIFVARPLLALGSCSRWGRRLGWPWGRVSLSTDQHSAAGSARDSKARTAWERGLEHRNTMIKPFPVLMGRLSSEAVARRTKPSSQPMLGL